MMVVFRSRKYGFLAFILIQLALGSIASGAVYSTKVTAKGPWTTVSNWSTTYPGCCIINGGATDVLNIYGYITVGTTSASQSLTISKGLLSVMDTLIIYGDLSIGNNGDLTIGGNGVLIVYGNVTIDNQVTLAANSYFVIMGNLTKAGSQGTFTSDDQPSNVFIGGTIAIPKNWADSGPTDVFNCTIAQHDSSGCNWGNPIDLQDSPIGDLVNANCTEIPAISTISSNSPVLAGSAINLSANATTSSSWPLTYYWTGPSSFTSNLQNPSRASATLDMSGYYTLSVLNTKHCATSDSVYVEVTSSSCCSGSSYISRDNYTGNWEDENSWATPNESWRPLPPPTNPMNTQSLCINGRITVNGDLTINGGNQKICDTLIIAGNLNVQSYSLNVSSTGVLIVLGNFTGLSGSMDVDGRVVVVGDITSPFSNSVTNDGSFYVFDDTPAIEGFIQTGDENTLQNNDPSLFNLIVNLTCDPAFSGGTIAAGQTLCEGIDVEAFTSISDASPGTFTYQWYYSTNSSDPATGIWNMISGATSATYDAGPLTTTTNYYRRAIKLAGCSRSSNVITIDVYALPDTGDMFRFPNDSLP